MAPACGSMRAGVAPCHGRVVKERDGLYLEGVDGAVFVNNGDPAAPSAICWRTRI